MHYFILTFVVSLAVTVSSLLQICILFSIYPSSRPCLQLHTFFYCFTSGIPSWPLSRSHSVYRLSTIPHLLSHHHFIQMWWWLPCCLLQQCCLDQLLNQPLHTQDNTATDGHQCSFQLNASGIPRSGELKSSAWPHTAQLLRLAYFAKLLGLFFFYISICIKSRTYQISHYYKSPYLLSLDLQF